MAVNYAGSLYEVRAAGRWPRSRVCQLGVERRGEGVQVPQHPVLGQGRVAGDDRVGDGLVNAVHLLDLRCPGQSVRPV
jgi:hypothetical protein